MAVLTWLGNGLRRVIGLILPVFAKARDFRGMSSGVRWTLHLLLLAGILVGLFFLNKYVERWIPGSLSTIWLPLLFLLVYVLAWLGWWLWKLLGQEEAGSAFPDLDAAWAEALQALNHAGIDVTEVPLFLVLGRPAGPEEGLFQATQLALKVKQAPVGPNAPLHVYANADGIYVTCAGASLLGRHAGFLAGEVELTVSRGGGGDIAPADDPFVTHRPNKGVDKEVGDLLVQARKEGRELTGREKRAIRRRDGLPVPQLLKDTSAVEHVTTRLRHVCRLIAQTRQPYCPINGILLLVPFDATDNEEDANQTARICQLDLTAAREVLRVQCPLFALVCDLEVAPGFRELIGRLPAEQRHRRLGQRFPMLADMKRVNVPEMIAGGVSWIFSEMMPGWIYKLFRVEAPGRDDVDEVLGGNIRLYQLLEQMPERGERLGRVLTRGVLPDDAGPSLFGGCYLGATGPDPREQAFVAGVFRRLVEKQSCVAWTPAALAEEASLQRRTRYGYLTLAGVAAAIALVVVGYYAWKP